MVKKRRLTARGQITVFMILGLIILFVALFLLQLSYSAKKGEIDSKQAEIISQLFQKEGLRLYIQDCLADPVRHGLDLIAKQGTIWKFQNGRKEFDPQINGLELAGEDPLNGGRVLYGISAEEYSPDPYMYPCDINEVDPEPPHFCQYFFPTPGLTFGKKESLSLNTLRKDLQSYIAFETTECIKQFAEIETLPVPELDVNDIKNNMKVILNDNLIAVQINSPVSIKKGEQQLFTLSSFDAIYPTNFVKFFKTYVDVLVRYDVNYLDFEFKEDKINLKKHPVGKREFITNSGCTEETDGQKTYYKCDITAGKYAGELQPELTIEPLNDGDDLFTITTGEHQIRFLRQNRPPALDYVNRSACPVAGYDYLVIKDFIPESCDYDIPADHLSVEEDSNIALGYKSIPPDSIISVKLSSPEFELLPVPYTELTTEFNILVAESPEFDGSEIAKSGIIPGSPSPTSTTSPPSGSPPSSSSPHVLSIPRAYLYYLKYIPNTKGPHITTFTLTSSNGETKYNIFGTPKCDPTIYEDYAKISIDLFSEDPDEDSITYEFDYSDLGGLTILKEDTDKGILKFSDVPTQSVDPYEIHVKAIDQHGKEDGQIVRVLVDRSLEMSVDLNIPEYTDEDGNPLINDYFGSIYVSAEDPAFLDISWPEDSSALNKPGIDDPTVKLDYKNEDNDEEIHLIIPQDLSTSGDCYSFPYPNNNPGCDLANYDENDIETWQLDGTGLFDHFSQPTTTGELLLSFDMNYCQTFQAEGEVPTELHVKKCIPHRNPDYKYPYPNHMYKFDLETGIFNGIDSVADQINPFEASHICCEGDPLDPNTWDVVAEDSKVCFIDPTPKCSDQNNPKEGITGYTKSSAFSGYILEQAKAFCDGERGNTCTKDPVWEKLNGELTCGDSTNINLDCRGAPECTGADSWGYTTDEFSQRTGWCNGKMGCQNHCTTEIVYYGPGGVPNFNLKAVNDDTLQDNQDLQVACGCDNVPAGVSIFDLPCNAADDNGIFDTSFNGKCQDGGTTTNFFCDGDN
tara:strand:+ start:2619 stop:5690 length:3072 start_codon:yes stop_codon:yes gene_type:complete